MQLIKFTPVLKTTLWGGDRIIPFKHLDCDSQQIGESWEVSGVKDFETVVKDGQLKGKSLNELVRELKGDLVGEENYQRFGDEFPLLVKFIDAQQDLSIQVHPDDETAVRLGEKHGKTEMWYIMNSDPEAFLYCGLKQEITAETYKEMVEDGTICDALAKYQAREGDVFFLPAGRIHAVGAGCFLTEIQQTSDLTYRIYDYNRKDKNGNLRELHTEKAAESIHFKVEDDYCTHYRPMKNMGVPLVECPYFSTSLYDLDETMILDYSELDSFVILVGLKGSATLVDDEGNETTLQGGESVLIPATTKELKVTGTIRFLETYV